MGNPKQQVSQNSILDSITALGMDVCQLHKLGWL